MVDVNEQELRDMIRASIARHLPPEPAAAFRAQISHLRFTGAARDRVD